ncbi:restriction endonuclease [Mucilaginibacter sp.]|uniref:restriction endonuclease n=1 Tax=Mucilaginibacter sp. TaxID=1882438 RepID=UPI0025FF6BCD|nr:restriction endonuclease [Mucilaginibacter sp.]
MQGYTLSENLTKTFTGRSAELEWLDSRLSRHSYSFTPMIITGAGGVGKTSLIKYWLSTKRLTSTPYWLDLYANKEYSLDDFVNQIDKVRHGDSMIVVIDGSEAWTEEQHEQAVSKIFNYKAVSALIFTSRKQVKLRRYEQLNLGPMSDNESSDLLKKLLPDISQESLLLEAVLATKGYPLAISLLSRLLQTEPDSINALLKKPLYELSNNILVPKNEILIAAPPIIITANKNLASLLKKQPSDLHKLTPREFETLLAELLADMGWEVELTKQTRDGGTDILAYLNTDIGRLLCLVEAKHYRPDRKIGVDLVRTLYGTLCDAQANSAMLVTSSTFTADAREFQQKHKYQLTLRDYADVVTWILKYGSKQK